MTITFADASVPDYFDEEIPKDSAPPTVGIEHPCRKCGKEAGPYGGRGPKPKLCTDCKPKKSGSTGARVNGSTANLAGQATAVLVQLNSIIGVMSMGFGMFETAKAIHSYTDKAFEEQLYQALVTDPEFCKFLLKGGTSSAKVSLAIAYAGMGMAVGPTAYLEYKEKAAARKARKLDLINESSGT